MNRLEKVAVNTAQRKRRIRSKVSGTATRPRLSVFVSNVHVSAQIIDDTAGKTLIATSSQVLKLSGKTMIEKAEAVGTEIAKQAKTKKIKAVVFDRNGKVYHGRVQALADAARKEGLEF